MRELVEWGKKEEAVDNFQKAESELAEKSLIKS